MDPLLERAAAVLRANDRGRVTIPSARLYPHQWAWDSAFIAIGWAHIDTDRALIELESLFEGQWEDGRIPHIQFQAGTADYFPGPELWGRERSSTISNPPMWVIALARIAAAGGDRDRVAALIEPCRRSLAFFAAARDPLGTGAVAIVHPWESGRDNCPAWDRAMEAVDPDRAPPFKRVDLAKVGDPSQRPTDEEYKRYVVLVRAIAESDFGPGELAVYDPMMTALTLWAERELASLAGEEPGERAAALAAGLDWLWDADAGRFAFHDAVADRRETPELLAAYLPLIALPQGGRRQALVAAIRDRYRTRFGFPTVPPGESVREPRRYWRGPSWINMNWLFAQAPELAADARAATRALVETSGFHEYFHSETGEGLGADQFSWTAALLLDLES